MPNKICTHHVPTNSLTLYPQAATVPTMSWLKIRADDDDLAKWKARAAAAGMDFSKWVRAELDGEPGAAKISTPEIDSERRAGRRGKSTVKVIEDVTHTALRKLASSLPNTSLGAQSAVCEHGAPLNQCKVWGCWFYEHSNGRGAVKRTIAPDTPMSGKEEKPGQCSYGELGDKKCPQCGKVHSRV